MSPRTHFGWWQRWVAKRRQRRALAAAVEAKAPALELEKGAPDRPREVAREPWRDRRAEVDRRRGLYHKALEAIRLLLELPAEPGEANLARETICLLAAAARAGDEALVDELLRSAARAAAALTTEQPEPEIEVTAEAGIDLNEQAPVIVPDSLSQQALRFSLVTAGVTEAVHALVEWASQSVLRSHRASREQSLEGLIRSDALWMGTTISKSFAVQTADRLIESLELSAQGELPRLSAEFVCVEPPGNAGAEPAAKQLLAVLAGNGDLSDWLDGRLATLDSLVQKLDSSDLPRCAREEVLVLVRRELEHTKAGLAERAELEPGLVESALKTIVSRAAEPLPDLAWFVAAGEPGSRAAAIGGGFPPGIDVAWTLGRRLGLRDAGLISRAAQQTTLLEMLPAEILKKVHRADVELASVIEDLADGRDQAISDAMRALTSKRRRRRTPPGERRFPTSILRPKLLAILRHPIAEEAPELAVELALELVNSRGVFTWSACLRLANARLDAVHRYIESAEPGVLKLTVDVQARDGGEVEIFYSVVEQPLSPRFRKLFETKNLEGRVRLLWNLVEYAARARGEVIRLGSSDALRQVAGREGALWGAIQGGPS